jgi:ParB/RepB/Spo0J family partition protein
MESEQFASLGDRIQFDFEDRGKPTASKVKRSSLNIARRLTFVLFEEIVKDSPSQTRTVIFDPKKNKEDEELLESIKQHGIITPIIVRGLGKKTDLNTLNQKKSKERNFALIAGHRRVAAGRAAGLVGTEAVIAKASEDYQLLTLVENMGRRELTSYEKALALKNLKLRLKLSVRKVAEITGYSKTHVGRLVSSLESPEILQQLWQKGNTSETAIDILKDHWQLFTEGKSDHLKKNIKNLTQSESSILCEHLDSGLDLENAIQAAKARKRPKSISKGQKDPTEINLGKISADNIDPAKDNVKDIAKNMHIVFPGITEHKANALFLTTVASNVLDTDVIWAAAFYVARGGPIESAIEICSKVMSNQEYRNSEVDAKDLTDFKNQAVERKSQEIFQNHFYQ